MKCIHHDVLIIPISVFVLQQYIDNDGCNVYGRRNLGGGGGLPLHFFDIKKINGDNTLEWCKCGVKFEFF